MKILVVYNYYPVRGGGEDSVVADEVELLKQAGHEVVCFFEQTYERGFFDFVKSALLLFWNPFVARRFKKVLRAEKPDVVHFHNTFPIISPAVYWACRRAAIPSVHTLHNYRLVCINALLLRGGKGCEKCIGKTFGWQGIVYRCYRGSLLGSIFMALYLWVHRVVGTWTNTIDRYLVSTEFARKKIGDSGLIPLDKIQIKPIPVSVAPSHGRCPEKSPLPKSYVLYVGRLAHEKGCDLLIDAWEKVSHRFPDSTLVIVGDGPESEVLQAKASTINNLVFMGGMDRANVFDLMKKALFVVFPSRCYETFGMTVVEAGLLGKAAVVAFPTAIGSILHDGETGLCFESGNVNDLHHKIEWALNHPDSLAVMGEQARSFFTEHYTPAAVKDQLERIYQELIQAGS